MKLGEDLKAFVSNEQTHLRNEREQEKDRRERDGKEHEKHEK